MNSVRSSSFAVIGAGINGAAVANELTRRFPAAKVTVFEKAATVAAHQTGHNSGVVHAGLYYQPGSLKARLCRRGVELMTAYAQAKGVPYEACGKLVVALDPDERPRLEAIFERAVANGVPDVALIGPDELRRLEPNAVGVLALHSPHTAIIDFAGVTRALIDDVQAGGGTIRLATEVTDVSVDAQGCVLTTRGPDDNEQTEQFDYVIGCAGLQSDRLARMAGGAAFPAIVPFFGQYAQLAPTHRQILNGLVYPVPDPAYPFLGVHLTKRVDGEMLVGPNAFLSFGRENYTGWQIGLKDTAAVLTNQGFWKFAARNMKAAIRELTAVVSRKKFLNGATAYVPKLDGAQATPITRGIRAQAMDEDGQLVDDFVIEHLGRATFIRNAPSPGATSSMAIAEYIVDEVSATHGLNAND
ncbi:L-2-hydroxyglutarate oxidase [Enteractinococcus fodinae]|uniref:L-2-hydroxyglutarate oxidase LhgO n=1 Tax=Enteractinococcus fodinae TaxID=684663 RepID=A0ABU2AYB0_9MICC|nr:L-2-hydroxyglutarate oxidase [Enteractinococcus fodinae]MDR7346349.1 L-2-hydroxyglutarate oxidase LhgO [Enteractinococcus fodinae]